MSRIFSKSEHSDSISLVATREAKELATKIIEVVAGYTPHQFEEAVLLASDKIDKMPIVVPSQP